MNQLLLYQVFARMGPLSPRFDKKETIMYKMKLDLKLHSRIFQNDAEKNVTYSMQIKTQVR